jgi:hypothetical protein
MPRDAGGLAALIGGWIGPTHRRTGFNFLVEVAATWRRLAAVVVAVPSDGIAVGHDDDVGRVDCGGGSR